MQLMKLYRKEPLVAFALTIGLVDAALGGFTHHSNLVTVGMGLLGMALGMGIWQTQHRPPRPKQPKRQAVYVLPPAEPRPNLPPLHLLKKTPPNTR